MGGGLSQSHYARFWSLECGAPVSSVTIAIGLRAIGGTLWSWERLGERVGSRGKKDRENKCEKSTLGPSAHIHRPDFTLALQRVSPSCSLSDSRSSALVCDILLPPMAYPESRWPINVSSWCRLTCKCRESDRSWQCTEGHLPHVWISFVPSRPQGNALVHLNTDVTVFVGDHKFFSLNINAMWVMFSLKRKAQ